LLDRLHTDEVLRDNVSSAAAKAALHWTWDANAAGVWDLLKDAASKKAVPSARKP